MSFRASNNRIWVTNNAGGMVFDTEKKMPVIVGSVMGSFAIRGVQDETLNIVLGYCDPAANFLFPTLRMTVNSAYAFVPQGIPFSCPGSMLLSAAWAGGALYSGACMSIVQENGAIIARKSGRIEVTNGLSFDYRIYVGRFV